VTTHADTAYAYLSQRIGKDEGSGDWLLIAQDRITAFAEVTEDRQFIHVDPVKSAEQSPWGTTVAHGFLTLSLLTFLCESIPQPDDLLNGLVIGMNYGANKIRLLSPVKVNSRIRANSTLLGVEQKDANTLQATHTLTVEIEDEAKPALVAEWIVRLIYS